MNYEQLLDGGSAAVASTSEFAAFDLSVASMQSLSGGEGSGAVSPNLNMQQQQHSNKYTVRGADGAEMCLSGRLESSFPFMDEGVMSTDTLFSPENTVQFEQTLLEIHEEEGDEEVAQNQTPNCQTIYTSVAHPNSDDTVIVVANRTGITESAPPSSIKPETSIGDSASSKQPNGDATPSPQPSHKSPAPQATHAAPQKKSKKLCGCIGGGGDNGEESGEGRSGRSH